MKPESLAPDMTALGASHSPGIPTLRRACTIRADIGPAVEFTTTPGTTRAMFPIAGGVACGRGWAARILPGGADFAIGFPDGSYVIEARYCLEMTDGTLVVDTNAGKRTKRPGGGYPGRTRATLGGAMARTAHLETRVSRNRAGRARRRRLCLH